MLVQLVAARQANMEIGLRLQPEGVIAAHVTNAYLDLAPVVERLARELGLHVTRIVTESDSTRLCFRSDYVLVSRRGAVISVLPRRVPDDKGRDIDVPVWTDQYSNLFQMLKRD